jgi:hypothetical protein
LDGRLDHPPSPTRGRFAPQLGWEVFSDARSPIQARRLAHIAATRWAHIAHVGIRPLIANGGLLKGAI